MFRISRRMSAAAIVALLVAGLVVLGFAAATDGDLDPFGHHGGGDEDGAGHTDGPDGDGDVDPAGHHDGEDDVDGAGHDDDDDAGPESSPEPLPPGMEPELTSGNSPAPLPPGEG